MVHRAELAGASDIHLQMEGNGARVAFRLDGVMTPMPGLVGDVAERVVGRIKYLSRLKTYQETLPQDGRIDRADIGSQNDIRVATYPTVTGEKVVLRLFARERELDLEALGIPAGALGALKAFLAGNSGLLLLTGPAGSGKTTTIYACLRHLVRGGGRHIITIEDPAEQIIPGVMQTEVNEARGLTFAKAARHLLRQDPQVLVIGEIRDEETASLAVRAALTGHQVISTLHAGSCKGVFERLMVMCPDAYATVSSVALVLNQRLIRRVCAECCGRGCPVCVSTGYRGRMPLVEWVAVDDALRGRLRAQGPEAVRPVESLEEYGRAVLASGGTNAAEFGRVFGLDPLSMKP
jgi:type II secretory ATPase GspE/PulE/Tfp pilus assembly ATPase PilB-like protein